MTDPLFMSGNFYPDRIRQIEDERQKIAQQYEELKRQGFSRASSPLWDEIDSIVAGLSESEIEYLNKNERYIKSSAGINDILNREYLNIMRPIVEATEDGKIALKSHLELLKELRKSAKDAVNQRYTMLEDYMAHYSDITFKEYLNTVKNKGGQI